MAVTFNTLFTRLGSLFAMAEDARDQQGQMSTAHANMVADFTADISLIEAISGQLESMQSSLSAATYSQIQRAASTTLIEMMDDDTPLISKTVDAALDLLITQMRTASEFIEDNTVAAGTILYGSSNTGTGKGMADIVLPDANITANSQRLRAESIIANCTADAQVRGTAGRETFTLTGDQFIANSMSALWPGGNGASGSSLRVVDPSQNAGTTVNRNILTNSDFEDFTSDDPDNWTLQSGWVAATDVNEEGTEIFNGAAALNLLGDGSTTGDIMRQALDTAGQTTGKLKPNTRYCISFWTKVDSAPAAGTLRIRVTDGAGSVLNGGSANVTVDLTSETSSYAHNFAFFTTPTLIPTGTRIVLEMQAFLTTSRNAYVDDLALFEAQQIGGLSGPFLAITRGALATPFIRDDQITFPFTNNDAGKFARFFDMFFDTFGKGKQIPFSGSATQADSKIS